MTYYPDVAGPVTRPLSAGAGGTALTVTAAQSGSGGTANGIALTVKVITGQASSPIGATAESASVTTPELAITPDATGSWVYGAVAEGASSAFTAAGTTTFSQNFTSAGVSYGTFRSTGTTTASTPVTLGGTAPSTSTGGIALCEIEKGSGSLAEDPSSPATADTTSATTVTTASFAPPAGSLLVATVASNGSFNGTNSMTMTVSDSSGLTWTRQSAANVASGSATYQVASVWTAPVAAAANVAGVAAHVTVAGGIGTPAGGTSPGNVTGVAARVTVTGGTGTPAATNPAVVNQWAATFAQPASFGPTPPALQSTVIALNSSTSVGGGSGTPSEGNWLFCICGWNQAGLTAATVGDADDIHSLWRPGNVWASDWAVSSPAGSTRTSIWYTANLARSPADVYVAPSGAVAGMACLVIEVAGLGPWDTVTGIDTAYANSARTLTLALGAPAAASFMLAAVCGDNSAASQAFAPAGGPLCIRSPRRTAPIMCATRC